MRAASIPALPPGGSCPGQAGADLGRFLLAVPSKEAAPRCAKGNCSAHPSSSKKDVTGDAFRRKPEESWLVSGRVSVHRFCAVLQKQRKNRG